MRIAFYKVDNSKEYERHTFDYVYDKPQEILKMLSELDDDEWRMYDLAQTGLSSSDLTLSDFEDDYNDEMLDGGEYWSVIIRDEEPKREQSNNELFVRLGIFINPTDEEMDKILKGDIATLQKVIKENRYEIGGDTYVPSTVIESYNEENGTDYNADDIGFELYGWCE